MGNDLNSLLIEGELSGTPRMEGANEDSMLSFRILCRRDSGDYTGSMPLDVVAYGDLARKYAKRIKEGMTVRVVGHLWNSPLGGGCPIALIAKHLEYKGGKRL